MSGAFGDVEIVEDEAFIGFCVNIIERMMFERCLLGDHLGVGEEVALTS